MYTEPPTTPPSWVQRARLCDLTGTCVPSQDPYFMKNHLGSYECKLCLTLHNNEVRASPAGQTWGILHW